MALAREEFKAQHNNIITVMENHIMMIAHCDRNTENLVTNEVLDLDRGADRLINEEVKGNTAFSNPYDDINWDGE